MLEIYKHHYLSIVISDTFQIISTCGRNSPLICGENAVSEKMFLIYSDFDEKYYKSISFRTCRKRLL